MIHHLAEPQAEVVVVGAAFRTSWLFEREDIAQNFEGLTFKIQKSSARINSMASVVAEVIPSSTNQAILTETAVIIR